ncbi:SCO6745 family protein [Streptomyces sp. P1-3]|uniref:SCO6745 family protein n=1 Tax=Streptomyces sp. P1-3 TaxID=3421658 RepID=UPI003D359DE7
MTRYQALARHMWHQLEPVHAALYFAPEAFEEAAALGYDVSSRWPSYFAWRTAPLGATGPELVAATYYSFSPRTVAEYVPAIWSVATPEQVLAARLRAVDRIHRALVPDRIGGAELAEAAELAREAAEHAILAGRPLAAANRDLGWSDEPHLALWQAVTVLREHRGDGHLAALLAAGLDPCETLVSFAAVDAAPEANFAGRGWTEQEWAAARNRLAGRGWIDAAGKATERGRQGRDEVERQTDALAAQPWQALGTTRAERLAELILPLLAAVFESGTLPRQSTLGIGSVQVTYA